MGSGQRPRNVKSVPSPIAEGGGIRCPESGSVPARILVNGYDGALGSLEVRSRRLLMVVDGVAVAEVVGSTRLRGCAEAGFAYRAILEDADDQSTIRYRSE